MKFQTVEENNKQINARGLVGYEGEFVLSFRDSKRMFFTVDYGSIGHLNQDPSFGTTAQLFNRNRSDYERCGQAQDMLTNKQIKGFFDKWDICHFKALTFDKYKELMQDIEILKETIPYISNPSFSGVVELDRELS